MLNSDMETRILRAHKGNSTGMPYFDKHLCISSQNVSPCNQEIPEHIYRTFSRDKIIQNVTICRRYVPFNYRYENSLQMALNLIENFAICSSLRQNKNKGEAVWIAASSHFRHKACGIKWTTSVTF